VAACPTTASTVTSEIAGSSKYSGRRRGGARRGPASRNDRAPVPPPPPARNAEKQQQHDGGGRVPHDGVHRHLRDRGEQQLRRAPPRRRPTRARLWQRRAPVPPPPPARNAAKQQEHDGGGRARQDRVQRRLNDGGKGPEAERRPNREKARARANGPNQQSSVNRGGGAEGRCARSTAGGGTPRGTGEKPVCTSTAPCEQQPYRGRTGGRQHDDDHCAPKPPPPERSATTPATSPDPNLACLGPREKYPQTCPVRMSVMSDICVSELNWWRICAGV